MRNNRSVAILLATCNSEPYLSQQLESLINQTFDDWTLYIHDDGSNDSTLKIIYFYINKYKGKIVLLEAKSTKLGVSLNFQAMLNEVDSSYYMFCDHDDVWLPQKIEVTLRAMKSEEYNNQGKPVLVHTDLKVVDKHLNIIHQSFYRYSKTDPLKFCSFNFLGVANCVTGCTMMINDAAKRLVQLVPEPGFIYDWWIALNMSKKGIIKYLPEPTVLYRQHEKNLIGAKGVGITYFYRILRNLKETIRIDAHNYQILRVLKYGSVIKYIYYKLLFQIRRQMIW